jgi:hypothetical protein
MLMGFHVAPPDRMPMAWALRSPECEASKLSFICRALGLSRSALDLDHPG